MTRNKHFKALVRARAARTGEAYTLARSRLMDELHEVRLELVETIQAHDKHCIAVRFTPDGRELLTGGFGGQARIWSTHDWARIGDLVGHTASVNGFGLDRQGHAVTVSSDGSVRLWDVPARRELGVLAASKVVGLGVDIRADGRLAATGSNDGRVRFHSLPDIGSDQTPAPLRMAGRITAIAFEPAGDRLAVASVGGGVQVLRPDGTIVAALPDLDAGANARWSPDGSLLMCIRLDGVVVVFETIDWTEVRRVEIGPGGLLPIAASPDGSLIALGWEHHVAIWQALEDDPVVTIDKLPKGVYALDFSPDGRLLAQGGADGRVRIWRVRA